MITAEGLGRSAVACKPIEPGELVLQEEAFAWVPDWQVRQRICHACACVLPQPPDDPQQRYPCCSPTCAARIERLTQMEAVVYDQLEQVAAISACDLELLWLVARTVLTGAGEAAQLRPVLELDDQTGKFPAKWVTAVQLLSLLQCRLHCVAG